MMTLLKAVTMSTCKICGNASDNQSYVVKEMYIGLREEFNYFQCSRCGCLQILSIPDSMEKYYPESYFSFRDFNHLAHSPWRHRFDQWRVRKALTSSQDNMKWINSIVRPLDYVEWMKAAGLGLDAKVLDVGCGNGKMLLRMHLGGIEHCTGADLFIKEDILYPNGLTIKKIDFREMPGPWDLIMFHHSLEHMTDPEAVLRAAAEKLSPKGAIVVRIPMADSKAWEKYKVHWANLDAPRHFFLFTEKSLETLLHRLDLEIFHRFRDATASQFILSELYSQNIPRGDAKKFKASLGKKTLLKFSQQTKVLNKTGQGDCGGFLIRKSQASSNLKHA